MMLVLLVLFYHGMCSNADIKCEKGEIRGMSGSACCPEWVSKGHTQWSCIGFASKCLALCDEGYAFPNGDTIYNIHCRNGEWINDHNKPYQGHNCQKIKKNSNHLPKQISDDSHRNGKELTEIEFEGKSKFGVCDFLEEPVNTRIYCRKDGCIAECMDSSHKFWNGKSILHLKCTHGTWKITEAPSILVTSGSPACVETRFPITENTVELSTEQTKQIGGKSDSNQCKGIAVKETVGMLRKGNCTNKEPIRGFISCDGTCHSYVNYNGEKNGLNSSKCECCQATEFSAQNIVLECEKGPVKQMKMRYFKAVSCACGPCITSFVPKTTPAPPWNPPKPGCPERECD